MSLSGVVVAHYMESRTPRISEPELLMHHYFGNVAVPSSATIITIIIHHLHFHPLLLIHTATPLSHTPSPTLLHSSTSNPLLFLIPSFIQLNDAMKDPRPLPPRHKAESSLKHWQEVFFFLHTHFIHPPALHSSNLHLFHLHISLLSFHCPPLHHLHFLLIHFEIHKLLLFYDMEFVPAFTKAACETGQANRQQVRFFFFYNPPASSLSIFIVITIHHQPSPPTTAHHHHPGGGSGGDLERWPQQILLIYHDVVIRIARLAFVRHRLQFERWYGRLGPLRPSSDVRAKADMRRRRFSTQCDRKCASSTAPYIV